MPENWNAQEIFFREMPPRRELCRNFQRGSCQYGERCKFLHVNPQQAKPNPFGFGTQTGTQFQSQPQKPNPFGFGVQSNTQIGSKPNQFKPGENKWSRFSPLNAGNTTAPQKPDSQPSAPNHQCTDPESCKRQIIEDFQNEKPLWKLTCYGHCKNGPCDIVGEISYEELRAAAYDDGKRGMSMQSIVERERNLVNSKLVEFESLLRNPYRAPANSTLVTQSPFPGSSSNMFPQMTPSNAPPLVSSFSQLGTSLNTGFQMRPAAPISALGQVNQFQAPTQTSNQFQAPTQTLNLFQAPAQTSNQFQAPTQTSNASEQSSFMTFGRPGGMASQPSTQSFVSSFPATTTAFGDSRLNAERNPFSTTAISASPNSTSNQSSKLFNDLNSSTNGVSESSAGAHSINVPKPNDNEDNSIWFKEEWRPGEIPEEAPPEAVIY